MLPVARLRQGDPPLRRSRRLVIPLAITLLYLVLTGFVSEALAHGVATGDKGYIQEITGVNLIPFMYLGAKHMVTGYDHLLFLFGVIFFLSYCLMGECYPWAGLGIDWNDCCGCARRHPFCRRSADAQP